MDKSRTVISSHTHDIDFEKVRAVLVHPMNKVWHYEAMKKLVRFFSNKHPESQKIELLQELLQNNTNNEVS
jgi:hypothetical protein